MCSSNILGSFTNLVLFILVCSQRAIYIQRPCMEVAEGTHLLELRWSGLDCITSLGEGALCAI